MSSKTKQIEASCTICDKPSTLRCGACLTGNGTEWIYCSKEHQVQDWKHGHKKICEAKHESGVTAKDGGFIAKKDLPVGHLIFTLDPLLVIPRAPDEDEVDVFVQKRPMVAADVLAGRAEVHTCIGCNELLLYGYMVIDPPRQIALSKCRKCGWPLHSSVTPGDPSPCEIVSLL